MNENIQIGQNTFDMADRLVKQTYLFDFYGELLNEHQRHIYEAYVCDNLSFTEIAQENDVSRQSVHDLIKRCDGILEQYESKLHLLETFMKMKKEINEISELANLENTDDIEANLYQIRQISQKMLSEL